MSILERYQNLQESIRQHAGERPVTLVAVSKYATVAQVMEAYQAGIRHFGENKVQDALAKMAEVPEAMQRDMHWHFIGHLQSNKAGKTVGKFELIHAIDAVHQAEALSKANLAAGRVQPVLLQINLSADETRHGVLSCDARERLEQLLPMSGISVNGLMGMAPAEASLSGDPGELRRVFCGLKDLRDELAKDCGIDLPELSMGMSHDYVHALECGATIIRIGNYLFKN